MVNEIIDDPSEENIVDTEKRHDNLEDDDLMHYETNDLDNIPKLTFG